MQSYRVLQPAGPRTYFRLTRPATTINSIARDGSNQIRLCHWPRWMGSNGSSQVAVLFNFASAADGHGTRVVNYLAEPIIIYWTAWPFNGHIITADQRTTIQQYGDCYTGRWWVGLLHFGITRGDWAGLPVISSQGQLNNNNTTSICGLRLSLYVRLKMPSSK